MRILPFSLLIALLAMLAISARAQQNTGADINLYTLNVEFTRPADSTRVPLQSVFKKGKEPVVLAFWLTTCQPCMRELSAYAQQYPSWKQQAKFRMVAVSIDYPNRFRQINQVVKEKNLPFEALWDAKRSFKTILPGGLNGVPQVFLFSADGRLVWQHKGYAPGDEAELLRQIKAHQPK